jgi:hypothetical protein
MRTAVKLFHLLKVFTIRAPRAGSKGPLRLPVHEIPGRNVPVNVPLVPAMSLQVTGDFPLFPAPLPARFHVPECHWVVTGAGRA